VEPNTRFARKYDTRYKKSENIFETPTRFKELEEKEKL
jgi:hypothetical protein